MSKQQEALAHILERLDADPMIDREMADLITDALDDAGGSPVHRNTLYLILFKISTRRPYTDLQLERILKEALDLADSAAEMPLLAAA